MDKINLDRFKWRIWDKEKKEYIDQMDCCYWDLCFWYEPYKEDKESALMDIGGKHIPEQCTGLKDTNGELIYEGDILKSRYSDVMRYEVVYRNAGLCLRVFAIDKPETMDYLHIGEDVERIGLYEVIGNIHTGDNND